MKELTRAEKLLGLCSINTAIKENYSRNIKKRHIPLRSGSWVTHHQLIRATHHRKVADED